jgi:hypothetical protein
VCSTQHAEKEKRQKRVFKKSKGGTTGKKFFSPSALSFLAKSFGHVLFPKKFFVVFLNSPCGETHKNAIKKSFFWPHL